MDEQSIGVRDGPTLRSTLALALVQGRVKLAGRRLPIFSNSLPNYGLGGETASLLRLFHASPRLGRHWEHSCRLVVGKTQAAKEKNGSNFSP